ncbi:hypothetical protein [Paenibacillus naphthalenovorans]|uniref:Uncharacterized protein n=1 Tax=Paenibacillus naphthalenovorans TaxID=162209 RepID=A0A0U2M433_9BACL|nr:hypothetical protein [Paenibacillus naphthalenovorans]ALS22272.1 hypothetical protein IJ22_18980 [Paenibacillus naphthalenovorans]
MFFHNDNPAYVGIIPANAIFIQTCVCCNKKQFDEGEGIVTSDGWEVCSIECLMTWEGKNFPNHPLVTKNDKCVFCNGKGRIMHYHHIENGKCFRCNGTGKKRKTN